MGETGTEGGGVSTSMGGRGIGAIVRVFIVLYGSSSHINPYTPWVGFINLVTNRRALWRKKNKFSLAYL